jgi:hypothetical protein
MLFDELSARKTIETHRLDFDVLPGRGNTEESALMRAPHRETRRYFVRFSDHFFQGPLDVRKAASHHPDNREVPASVRNAPERGILRPVQQALRLTSHSQY